MNRYLILSVMCLLAPAIAGASEVTGTLATGVSTGVGGTVVSAPAATPGAGTYTSAQSVALAASGASSIRYTTDGAAPTCASGAVYSSAIGVSSSLTIKAVACYPSDVASSVASFAYTINIPAPAASGGGGGGGGGGSVSGGGGGGGGSFRGQVLGASTSTVSASTRAATPGAIAASTTATGGNAGGVSGTGASGSSGGSTGGGRVLGAAVYDFTKNLGIGSRGTDVIELQKILIAAGFLKTSATGYFGPATRAAVSAYQKAHGIAPASGYVGGLTRAVLNASIVPTATGERQAMIRKLQEQLQVLLAKIAALKSATSTPSTAR